MTVEKISVIAWDSEKKKKIWIIIQDEVSDWINCPFDLDGKKFKRSKKKFKKKFESKILVLKDF